MVEDTFWGHVTKDKVPKWCNKRMQMGNFQENNFFHEQRNVFCYSFHSIILPLALLILIPMEHIFYRKNKNKNKMFFVIAHDLLRHHSNVAWTKTSLISKVLYEFKFSQR